MKILKVIGLIALLPCAVLAGKPLTAEAPVNDHGTSGCVSVSTSAWTAVPTTALVGRTGIYVTEVSTNSANIAANLDNTADITVQPIIFKPSITQFHGLSDQEPLYLRSLHTAAESVCYDEVKQ